MSVELFSQLFLGDPVVHKDADTWLQSLVKRELEQIVASQPPLPDSGCLLEDLGIFLVQASAVLSRLSRGVVDGEHINTYAKNTIEIMTIQDGFSNLQPIDYMHDKHNTLKYITTTQRIAPRLNVGRAIASCLHNAAGDVDIKWKLRDPAPQPIRNMTQPDQWPQAAGPSTHSSISQIGGGVTQSDRWPETAVHSRSYPMPQLRRDVTQFDRWPETAGPSTSSSIPRQSADPETLSTEVWDEESSSSTDFPEAEEDIQNTIDVIINSLPPRGKNDSNTCPYRERCSKGGWLNNEPIVFRRNCKFK